VLASGFGDTIRDLFSGPKVLKNQVWFEKDGLREEMRPVVDDLLNRL
jgi:hypothetical protein